MYLCRENLLLEGIPLHMLSQELTLVLRSSYLRRLSLHSPLIISGDSVIQD